MAYNQNISTGEMFLFIKSKATSCEEYLWIIEHSVRTYAWCTLREVTIYIKKYLYPLHY